jgi:purine-binding chemotaxis protein CheW
MELESLLFEIAGRRHGAPLSAVREVFALGPLTPVPGAPSAVAGLTNLRGQVIPVVDLGRLWGQTPHRLHLGDPVVLVQSAEIRVGLVVDQVLGLSRLLERAGATAAAEASPPFELEATLASLQAQIQASDRPGAAGAREQS